MIFHRVTLISIMYPACMITVHDRKSGALQIGRYGGCFEEDIMRLMYDRAYDAKDLDAPA